MIYLRNNKVNTCYLGDKKLNKIYLGDKLVWPLKKSFDANGHDYVEIAGIKWATMNVGANKVTDYGLYFQWGDTQGYTKDEIAKEHKKKFASDWSDYKWYDKENSTSDTPLFTKYNSTDTKTILDLEDDAVHAAWGGSWRMPTSGEIATVRASTAVTKNWIPNYQGSNVAGYEFHDNNSNDTLFLPACGCATDGSVDGVGTNGNYWVSSRYTVDVSDACHLFFNSGGVGVSCIFSRFGGRCVRGVLAEN